MTHSVRIYRVRPGGPDTVSLDATRAGLTFVPMPSAKAGDLYALANWLNAVARHMTDPERYSDPGPWQPPSA